ncbi:unnamed protein product, partial [Chrysoparadoxa australica]
EQLTQHLTVQQSPQADVVVVGSGIGGLCCGALLAKYGLSVVVAESHYLPGGCTHAYEKEGFTFDAGPTIYGGFTDEANPNPLKQVLNFIEEDFECISYNGWMNWTPSGDFKFSLGPTDFRDTVLSELGGPDAVAEFDKLLELCQPLMQASGCVPPLALRGDKWLGITLLRFLPTLLRSGPLLEELTGSFGPVLDQVPITDRFLFNWLDLLAFALSGLPAAGTIGAAMAYTMADLHRPDAKLNYPLGGGGTIVDALVRGLEKNGGKLLLKTPVAEIAVEDGRAKGVVLKGGRTIKAKRGVVSNASMWNTMKLLPQGAVSDEFRDSWEAAPYTMSFMHLHLGIEGDIGPNVEFHNTVINRWDDVMGEQNMIAVSVPTKLDPSLAPPGCHIVHAYAAGNEPSRWEGLKRGSPEYIKLKEERAKCLWEAVGRIIPLDKVKVVGSPLTHEFFLRRDKGTYGPAFE